MMEAGVNLIIVDIEMEEAILARKFRKCVGFDI